MPIARSNTSRNRSHSPLPPSNGYPTLQRPFLPPSYYAAAAGISCSNSEKSSSRSECSVETTPSIMSKDSSRDTQEYHNAFMPISYTESGTASDSSFEFRVPLDPRYNLSRDKSITSPKTPARSKRQSHITGLPQLETHLLPSLRDTIDRMTRTPSNAGSFASPSGSTRFEISKTTENVLSTGSPPSSSPDPSSRSVLDESFSTRTRFPETSRETESHSAIPMEPATPHLKTPMKSALKSALRAPTPRLFSNPSLGTETVASSTSGGVSLKSVRSMLSRKISSASLSETPTPAGISGHKLTLKKQTPTPSFQYLRGRSRTDPGIARNSASQPSSKLTALSSKANYPILSSDNAKQGPSTSSIPRLRRHFDSDLRTDDSDFEFQYEVRERERRNLVVANAEIFASSSESETEAGGRLWAEKENMASKGDCEFKPNPHGTTNRVGLGLDLRNNTSQKQMRGASGRGSPNRHQEENWPAEGDIGRREPRDWATESRSQPTGRDGYKDYEPSSDNYLTNLDADHRRRRAALLGIVSDLNLQPSPISIGESEESEYYGEDGFAISGSGDLCEELTHQAKVNVGSVSSAGNGSRTPSETQLWRGSHEAQRPSMPRTSSHLSTYVLTDDESTRMIRGPSPSRRPRSTDRYSFPSPTATSDPMKGRKSFSRSPVVRQDDLASVPAALRRHSFYHRPLSTSSGAQPPNDGRLPKKSDYNRHDIDPPDALTITERSYEAAARERRALGIPPSESVEVYQGVPYGGGQSLPHADSDLSSVESQYWDEYVDELSPGAETLFRKLGGGPAKEINRSQENVDKPTRLSAISRRSSVSSVYEDQDPGDRRQDYYRDHDVTFETATADPRVAKGSPEQEYDNVEMRRQDLIEELCQTEKAFVHRLHTFVKLFVLPLRVQDTKTWILGVPSEVARLFDWLDDILNLHRELLSSLQSNRVSQRSIVEHVARLIHPFIPRLEVYQPYLVRLSSVTSLIQQLVQDEKSDFGEFVDLQEGAAECDGWKFDRFLAEPVNRLAQYPSFFSRLVGLTPKTHPDYFSTFLLLHSTDMVVRVMTEVKIREDEYDLIKNFLSRIGGLPSGPQIATRERRLLFHGVLYLLTVDDKEVTLLGNTLFPVNNLHDNLQVTQKNTNQANRTSRLANAVSIWDAHRGRSESTSSSSTGLSFETASSHASSDTSCSTFFPSFRIPPPGGRLSTTRVPEQKKVLASPSPNPRRPRTRGLPTQVFIFTDLMLLATLNSTLAPNNNDWTLLEDIGITRILGVSESSEQDSSEETLFVLDALPVDVGKLNQCINEKHGPVSPRPDGKGKNSWISAFQQCFRFTLRSATLLSRSKRSGYDLHSDHEYDTQQTVFSLLASGLPLPKSPSVQFVDFQHGQFTDMRKQEREERGWWSLRFQQVFRELQRQDMSTPLR